jgi:hypothetical protein
VYVYLRKVMQTNIETIIIILDFILFNRRPKRRDLQTSSNQIKQNIACLVGLFGEVQKGLDPMV